MWFSGAVVKEFCILRLCSAHLSYNMCSLELLLPLHHLKPVLSLPPVHRYQLGGFISSFSDKFKDSWEMDENLSKLSISEIQILRHIQSHLIPLSSISWSLVWTLVAYLQKTKPIQLLSCDWLIVLTSHWKGASNKRPMNVKWHVLFKYCQVTTTNLTSYVRFYVIHQHNEDL